MPDLPEHVRIGVTKDLQGPVLSEDDPEFDHWACWCGRPGCEEYRL